MLSTPMLRRARQLCTDFRKLPSLLASHRQSASEGHKSQPIDWMREAVLTLTRGPRGWRCSLWGYLVREGAGCRPVCGGEGHRTSSRPRQPQRTLQECDAGGGDTSDRARRPAFRTVGRVGRRHGPLRPAVAPGGSRVKGSAASCRPSPTKLKAMITSMTKAIGVISHGCCTMRWSSHLTSGCRGSTFLLAGAELPSCQ